MKFFLKLSGVLALSVVLLTGCGESDSLERTAVPITSSEADQAWARLLEASRSTSLPPGWDKTPPPRAEFEAFLVKHGERMAAGADLARDFHTRFPNDPKAAEAQERERRFLEFAVRAGQTNLIARLDVASRNVPGEAPLASDEQFRRRVEALRAKALSAAQSSSESVMQEFETGVRELEREFPGRGEIPAMLLLLAQLKAGEAGAKLANEVIASQTATPEMRQRARALLSEIERQRASAPAAKP